MINFFEIPKNAHTTLNSLLLPARTIDGDIQVVCLRQPLKRFWAACKTITPELSPFGNFPWTDESVRNAPTTYAGLDLTPAEVIATVKTRLQEDNLTDHLKKQTDLIGSNTFDHVIKVETLQTDLDTLCETYGLDTITLPTLTNSVNDWDDEAMEIINEDSYFSTYYEEDIELYNNSSILIRI